MARSFNGTTDLISLTAVSMTFPAGLKVSFSAWINTTAVVLQTIMASDTGSSPNRRYQFRVSATGKLQLILFQNSSTARTWTSTTSVNTGAWVHCGATYDGTTGIMYVNGAAEGSAALAANTSTQGNARIGQQLVGVTGAPFSGSISEVGMWVGAASAASMLGLAGGMTLSHLGADHYWPLWGGDSPEPDIGITTHSTGTLTGTTAVAGARTTNLLTRQPG